MCGIAGIYNLNGKTVSLKILKQMCDIMQYRGPDDEGYYTDNNIGLGHRRLSIIDLSTGHQPMSNEDETIWITYNGEIYNYIELMKYLQECGHVFRTKSDTEVILHAYEEYDDKCVDHFNGMFAFAIWDKRKQKLFCARDRLGIKPFYYFFDGERFLFASEIKAILQDSNINREPNYESILDYLIFQYTLDEKTFFKGIKKLLPGHSLSIFDGKLKIAKYWDFSFDVANPQPKKDLAERLYTLLEDSVRLRLRSDVPLGCTLSGGIDSSSIACLAARLLPHPVQNFSGRFKEGEEYDETKYARLVSKAINAKYFEVTPQSTDFPQILPKLIWHLDEPVVGPGVFPLSYVFKLASEHVKVVLGGEGGDELFGGYRRYLMIGMEQMLTQRLLHAEDSGSVLFMEQSLSSLIKYIIKTYGVSYFISYFVKRKFNPLSVQCYRNYHYIFDEARPKFFLNDFLKVIADYSPYESFIRYFHQANTASILNKMLYFDIINYLPGLLQVDDRISMAVSLEFRVPFLDYRLVRFSTEIPDNLKIKKGCQKFILRQSMKGVVPDEVLNRTDKKGFPVPLALWIRGELQPFVREILLQPHNFIHSIFNPKYIHTLWEEYLSGKTNNTGLIWSLLCLEIWHDIFICRR